MCDRQPYIIAFKCPECNEALFSGADFQSSALDFFHEHTGTDTIHKLIARKAQRACTRCKSIMVVSHLKYGNRL